MASSGLNQYYVRIGYTIVLVKHKSQFSVSVASIPTDLLDMNTGEFLARDTTPIPMQDGFEAFMAKWLDLLPTDAVITDAQLMFLDADAEWHFKGAFDLTGFTAGTDAGAHVNARQQTLIFRTAEGGIAKMLFMEVASSDDAILAYATENANTKALIDYLLSDDSYLVGKDDARPAYLMSSSRTQNERLYRIRFRP